MRVHDFRVWLVQHHSKSLHKTLEKLAKLKDNPKAKLPMNREGETHKLKLG